jgi:hypothetical protein
MKKQHNRILKTVTVMLMVVSMLGNSLVYAQATDEVPQEPVTTETEGNDVLETTTNEIEGKEEIVGIHF